MAAPQLSDLLTVPAQEDVLQQEVIPELQKRQVKTTQWSVGAVTRAFAYVVALLRSNVRQAIAAYTAAGFEDYAFGFSQPPANPDGSVIDVTGWAPIISQQRYGVSQIGAVYTRRSITLTNSSASPYGPLQPGTALMVQFPSGNRYLLDQVVTIPALGSVSATFRAEQPGASYNDPSGSALVLVTANYPGVTATNPAPSYTTPASTGSALGTVTPSGTPTGTHSVTVRIDSTGNAATAGWSTAVDGGAYVAQSGATATNLGGYGINVTLADNSGNPAFVAGTFFYFSTPGSDITQVGADAESAPALGARVRGTLPAMAFPQDSSGNWIPTSPTVAAYQALALSSNSQVRIALASTDSTVNNKINLVVAGSGGAPLSGAVVANVQAFFNAFSMLTDLVAVATTTARAITLAGLTVYCPSSSLSTTQAALTLRLQKYLGSIDAAAALGINGRVDYDYIIALVRTTPGVSRVAGTLTVNGAAADLQLPVTPGAYESATWSGSAASSFTWVTT